MIILGLVQFALSVTIELIVRDWAMISQEVGACLEAS